MITNYEEMPLGIYTKILSILEDEKRDDLSTQVALVAVLTGKTEQEVLLLPVPEFSDLSHQLGFLETPPAEKVLEEAPKTIELNGHKYEVHTDPTALTTAQFVDYQTAIKAGRDGWPGLVSILLVPEGKGYGHTGAGDPLAYDAEEVKRDVADYMPVTLANALANFFWRQSVASARASLTSLTSKIDRLPEGPERKKAEANLRRAKASLRVATALLKPSAGSTPSSR